MPKQKTHKGLAKRMRLTRRGKVVFRRAGKRHLMSTKSGKRRRALRRRRVMKPTEAKRYALALRRT